jgi:transposase
MVVRNIDRSTLIAIYPGGGSPAYDRQMMLKVILLAYASGIYSSRRIAKATRENIGFMWICGLHPLDHCTINRFRCERIHPVFEEIFSSVIELLSDMGLVDLNTYFLDGTKIEANANKFSFVWAKSNKRYQEQLKKKVHAHLQAIDELEDEKEALAPEEPAQIDSQKIEEAARRINERIEKKNVGKHPEDDEGKM